MGRFPEWNTDACCSLFWPYRYRIFFLLGLEFGQSFIRKMTRKHLHPCYRQNPKRKLLIKV